MGSTGFEPRRAQECGGVRFLCSPLVHEKSSAVAVIGEKERGGHATGFEHRVPRKRSRSTRISSAMEDADWMVPALGCYPSSRAIVRCSTHPFSANTLSLRSGCTRNICHHARSERPFVRPVSGLNTCWWLCHSLHNTIEREPVPNRVRPLRVLGRRRVNALRSIAHRHVHVRGIEVVGYRCFQRRAHGVLPN